MTTDNTTPSTGWTFGYIESEDCYCIYYPSASPFTWVWHEDAAIKICSDFNRLHSIDTASEVDVSDEATQAMSKEEYDSPITIPGSYTHVAINAHSKGFKQCRDLLLPQLAKAKAELAFVEDINSELESINQQFPKLQSDLSASQALVEQLRENIIHRDLEYGKSVSEKNAQVEKLRVLLLECKDCFDDDTEIHGKITNALNKP